MNKIWKNVGWTLMIVFVLGIIGCEQDNNPLGAELVNNGETQLKSLLVDLTTTNTGGDTIRSDKGIINQHFEGSVFSHATVGVYEEPVFGKTKVDFFTQVRLSFLSPEFGKNPIVDSVVLFLPAYAFHSKDTLDVRTKLLKEKFTLNKKDGDCSVKDTTYYYQKNILFALDSLYGNKDSKMKLQVHQVVEDMGPYDSIQFSNKNYQVGKLFGEGEISKKAYVHNIITSSGKIDDKSAKTTISESVPNFHIRLDGMEDFIRENLIEGNKSNLSDQISFVNNVLNGIRLSVTDENGFIFTFNPSLMKIVVYYSKDNEDFKDENGDGIHDGEEGCPVVQTEKRSANTYNLVIGSNIDNASTGRFNTFQSYVKSSQGSVAKGLNQNNVFLTGLTGDKAILKLNPEKISQLKDSVSLKHWAIMEARLKVYPDHVMQKDMPLPQYLYVYNYTDGKLIPDYGSTSTQGDIQAIPYNRISEPYDKEKGYYIIRITDFIKDIVEKNESLDELAIQVGNYDNPSKSYLFVPRSAYYSNRIYNPYRFIGFGGNPNGQPNKKLELEVFYSDISN